MEQKWTVIVFSPDGSQTMDAHATDFSMQGSIIRFVPSDGSAVITNLPFIAKEEQP